MSMYRSGERVSIDLGGPSRTKQSQKDDTNVNFIVNRFLKTGAWDSVSTRSPMYGDFSQVGDLQAAFEAVAAAQEQFMELPSQIRAAAQNDPLVLEEMLTSEEGVAELAAAGLPIEGYEPPQEPSDAEAPAVAPPTPAEPETPA